jgi:hypothetical protein
LPSIAKVVRAPARLEQLLLALEAELLGAGDEEILAALHDLGMKPSMQGSVAFLGLKSSFPKTLEDVFDLDVLDDATRARVLEQFAHYRRVKAAKLSED